MYLQKQINSLIKLDSQRCLLVSKVIKGFVFVTIGTTFLPHSSWNTPLLLYRFFSSLFSQLPIWACSAAAPVSMATPEQEPHLESAMVSFVNSYWSGVIMLTISTPGAQRGLHKPSSLLTTASRERNRPACKWGNRPLQCVLHKLSETNNCETHHKNLKHNKHHAPLVFNPLHYRNAYSTRLFWCSDPLWFECCNVHLPGCSIAVFGEFGLPGLRRNSDEFVTGIRLCSSDTLSSKPSSTQSCRLDNMI